MGSGGTVPHILILDIRQILVVSIINIRGKDIGTHWTRGRVGSRAGLNALEKRICTYVEIQILTVRLCST
jgi:hypothetical protein